VDNGAVFHNTYSGDGKKLRYEAVAGPTRGAVEEVDLHVAELAEGVFLVGWVEASGMTVTHGMNLNANTVQAFWTYETAGGRVAELHTGTLEGI
jgi:phenolic acid decarboxylase